MEALVRMEAGEVVGELAGERSRMEDEERLVGLVGVVELEGMVDEVWTARATQSPM